MNNIAMAHGALLYKLEWGFTLLFTAEFLLRCYCSKRAKNYVFSFFGMVDLLSIIPTYLEILFVGSHYLVVIRILRVLRIFRILKFVQYIHEAKLLIDGVKKSGRKIILFICAVLSISVILGSIMYVVEGGEGMFTSIPKSIYWAIVTCTTVGYGDITPTTPFGQAIATIIMILGYSVIVVPSALLEQKWLVKKRRNMFVQDVKKHWIKYKINR